MPREKVYSCCICHEVLKDYKPVRLVKQLYGASGYNQYGPVKNYDFCKNCYRKFESWVKKHSVESCGNHVERSGNAVKSGVRTGSKEGLSDT